MQPLCVVKEKISPQTLSGFTDRMIFRNIGVKLMTRKRKTYPPTGIDGLKPQTPEKPPDPLGIYLIALSPQPGGHLPCP